MDIKLPPLLVIFNDNQYLNQNNSVKISIFGLYFYVVWQRLNPQVFLLSVLKVFLIDVFWALTVDAMPIIQY